MAAKEDTSNALALLEASVPQLPDLKGKPGGATIKASEEDSKVVETHKTVSILGNLRKEHKVMQYNDFNCIHR